MLYEQDYYQWLEKTARLLRDGKLQELDISNLIEEVEDMGRSEKRALESNLRIVLWHLLKYKYQPEKRSNSWRVTLREHRFRLQGSIKDSPSLRNYLTENFREVYQEARAIAADETGLSDERFPSEPPFIPEEALNSEYLPD